MANILDLRIIITNILLAIRVIRLISNKGLFLTLRSCLRAAPIFLNFVGHIKLTKILLHPHVIGLTKRHPRLLYKYLGNYVARCFPRNTRLTILTNHYNYLTKYVNDDFLTRIFEEKIILWREFSGENLFSITLNFPHASYDDDCEGDLSLVFSANGLSLYVMSFTIIPGQVIKIANDQAIFISRVQGLSSHLALLRQATKNFHYISPAALLLVAVQAIALPLNIKAIVGVSTGAQISSRNETDCFFFDYDEFWRSADAERMNDNMFLLPVPLPEKPIRMIKQTRRSKVLRKRKFKRQLAEQVSGTFSRNFLQNR